MSERLVTERELEGILRRLNALETRLEREKSEVPSYVGPLAYTPLYFGGTTAGTTTYSAGFPVGAYIKIGSLVIATGTLVWTAATGTGDARISLPFTSANTTSQFFSGSVRTSDVTFANSAPQVVISPNTDYFIMQSPLSNNPSTTVAIEAAGNIIFTVIYFAAS